jgi:cytochrome c-type biogenesis protein CcmH
MHEGRSDAEIKDFLVARYGEFVLYRPRVQEGTWLLWFGPLLLLAGGALLIAGIVRRRSRDAGTRTGSGNASDNAGDEQEW